MRCENPECPRAGHCGGSCELKNFIEDVLDFKLYPWQKKVIEEEMWRVTRAARRADV